MKSYQLKILIKRTKPPVWRRCVIPSGITFSQLAVLLEEIMEETPSARFEFEFPRAGILLQERRKDEKLFRRWDYDYRCASDAMTGSLLDSESWFTFRICGMDDDLEYRVDVEKCLEEETLCPEIRKQKGDPQDRTWTDPDTVNRRLRERFPVICKEADHSGFAQLLQSLQSGRYGLRCARDPQEGQAEGETFRPDLQEFLSARAIADLRNMAYGLSIPGYGRMTKKELTEAVRNELLKPAVMEERLQLLSDGEIAAYEHAIREGGRYTPGPEELKQLERFYELGYIILYKNDRAEVPTDAAEAYRRIDTPEFREKRRGAFWMYHCLLFVDILYGSAPESVVCRLLEKCLDSPVSPQLFTELWNRIPEKLNPCLRLDGKAVSRNAQESGVYQEIEKLQGEKEFFIPSPEEILDYTEEGYPTADPSYLRLKSFLTGTLMLDEGSTAELLPAIWGHVSTGARASDIRDIFYQMEIPFPSRMAEREFKAIMTDVRDHTRLLLNRGWTRQEIRDRERADRIPAVLLPNGASGEMLAGSRKIYPNDPCPCGSGKKYKKCCGRKG